MTDTFRSNAPPKLDPEQLQFASIAQTRSAVQPRRDYGYRCGRIRYRVWCHHDDASGPALRIKDLAEDRYNIDRKLTAEGLDRLPRDYSGIKPNPPVLGPPLPRDLGRPILERQRQLGMAPGQEASAEAQHVAQQAIAARESQVMFRIESRPKETNVVDNARGAPPPFEVPLGQTDAEAARALVAPAEGDQNNQQRKLDLSANRIPAGSTIRMRCRRPLRHIAGGWPRGRGKPHHRHQFRPAWSSGRPDDRKCA